jgi:hypothetical protein
VNRHPHIRPWLTTWPGWPRDAPHGGQRHAYEKAGRDFCDFSEEANALVRQGLSFAGAKEKTLGQVRANFEAFLAERKRARAEQLMTVLRGTGDPRVSGDGQTYERPPFTDPEPGAASGRASPRARP